MRGGQARTRPPCPRAPSPRPRPPSSGRRSTDRVRRWPSGRRTRGSARVRRAPAAGGSHRRPRPAGGRWCHAPAPRSGRRRGAGRWSPARRRRARRTRSGRASRSARRRTPPIAVLPARSVGLRRASTHCGRPARGKVLWGRHALSGGLLPAVALLETGCPEVLPCPPRRGRPTPARPQPFPLRGVSEVTLTWICMVACPLANNGDHERAPGPVPPQQPAAPCRGDRLRFRWSLRGQGAAPLRRGRHDDRQDHAPPVPAAALPGGHGHPLRGRDRPAHPRDPQPPGQRPRPARRGHRDRPDRSHGHLGGARPADGHAVRLADGGRRCDPVLLRPRPASPTMHPG